MMIYFRGLHEAAVMKGCLALPSLRFTQPPFCLQHTTPLPPFRPSLSRCKISYWEAGAGSVPPLRVIECLSKPPSMHVDCPAVHREVRLACETWSAPPFQLELGTAMPACLPARVPPHADPGGWVYVVRQPCRKSESVWFEYEFMVNDRVVHSILPDWQS